MAGKITGSLYKALSIAPGEVGEKARFVETRSRLDAGERVDLDKLVAQASSLMDRADRAHAKGERDQAVDWADKALGLLFHKTVHYGPGLSPVKDRDLGFLAPIRESVVGKILTQELDEKREQRSGGRKILVLATSSWTFIKRVADRLGPEGFEFRFVDLTPLYQTYEVSRASLVGMRYDLSVSGRWQQVPAELAKDLEWADVVLAEWASSHATWLSFMGGMTNKLMCRFHSYEAFTPFPLLTNWANTDGLIFVSPHVRTMAEAMAPRIAQANVETILNIHDFTGYVADKEPGYERTLLMAGWANPVKDVLFAFDVLERLIDHDPSWKLLLAGADINRVTPSPYEVAVSQRLQALGDRVELLGYRDDMPEVYKRAGYLLSTSRHEGFHETINEGAASATLPVVRDWPEYAVWNGAKGLYPNEWVVEDSQHAAELILRVDKTGVLDDLRHSALKSMETTRRLDDTLKELSIFLTK